MFLSKKPDVLSSVWHKCTSMRGFITLICSLYAAKLSYNPKNRILISWFFIEAAAECAVRLFRYFEKDQQLKMNCKCLRFYFVAFAGGSASFSTLKYILNALPNYDTLVKQLIFLLIIQFFWWPDALFLIKLIFYTKSVRVTRVYGHSKKALQDSDVRLFY